MGIAFSMAVVYFISRLPVHGGLANPPLNELENPRKCLELKLRCFHFQRSRRKQVEDFIHYVSAVGLQSLGISLPTIRDLVKLANAIPFPRYRPHFLIFYFFFFYIAVCAPINTQVPPSPNLTPCNNFCSPFFP